MILSQSYEFAPATIKAYVLYTRNEIELKTLLNYSERYILYKLENLLLYFYEIPWYDIIRFQEQYYVFAHERFCLTCLFRIHSPVLESNFLFYLLLDGIID